MPLSMLSVCQVPALASIFAVLALTDDLLAETLRALDGRG